jgi:hypothetical protein
LPLELAQPRPVTIALAGRSSGGVANLARRVGAHAANDTIGRW